LDAELLIANILAKTREFIVSHPELVVGFFDRLKYYRAVSKRKNNTPIAYLLGYKEFYGLDFIVNKNTLVPRPETELLVEEALKHITNADVLIDIGTGSGCIPISILKNTKNNINTVAVDISQSAINVARKNAKKHGVNIEFLRGSLLTPIKKEILLGKKVVITANLPYLTESQYNNEMSIRKEPKDALVAEKKGLALYMELVDQIKDIDSKIIAIFEIDPSQESLLKSYIKHKLGIEDIKTVEDLAGHTRLVIFG